jgi:hypothetical protein
MAFHFDAECGTMFFAGGDFIWCCSSCCNKVSQEAGKHWKTDCCKSKCLLQSLKLINQLKLTIIIEIRKCNTDSISI